MHPKKLWLAIIILAGGSAVLGSYVFGAFTQPNAGQILWGGVPEGVRPAYTTGMFLGAAGYFAYTYFILFRLNARDTRVAGRFGYGLFLALYTAILIPSALWMPLTMLAIQQSNPALAWLVRAVLAVVALASLGLLAALLKVQPHQPEWAHRLAVGGSVAFCLQTVILDALFWSASFMV